MKQQGEGDASDQGIEASPGWHREELHKRRSEVLKGTADFLRWDNAMASLRAELRAHVVDQEHL